MKVTVINKEDIISNFSMLEAISAAKDAMRLYCMGQGDIPLRTSVKVPEINGNCLFMPGYVKEKNALGIKIVSVFPENINISKPTIPSMMILLNDVTGEVAAIIDGAYLTELRTGAVAGAATDILSAKNSEVFALFGTGGQARCQLEAILNVRNIKEVKVFDIDFEKSKKFCEEMTFAFSERFDVKIHPMKNSDDTISNSDIITCVTTSKAPVFSGNLVKKGAHINGVGAFTADMQEIDPALLKRSDKIYADTLDGVLNEAGDILKAIKDNMINTDDITGELGDVLLGNIAARENPDEITVFKTVGSGIFDVITAKEIYKKIIGNENKKIIEF